MAEKPDTSKSTEPHPVWLCVVEVADSSLSPRLSDKPCVRVEQKAIRPGLDLNAWLQRAQSSTRPEFVRVLYEKMPAETEPGGLKAPFMYPADIARVKKALARLRENLRCDGFTVGTKQETYSVYVIELEDGHIVKKPKNYRGHVYVGQTSLPVAERVRQHHLGEAYPWKDKPNHSTDCHKYFRRYAPLLVPERFRGPIPCRRKALWAERDVRLSLEAKGYRVIGGTDLLPKKKPKHELPE